MKLINTYYVWTNFLSPSSSVFNTVCCATCFCIPFSLGPHKKFRLSGPRGSRQSQVALIVASRLVRIANRPATIGSPLDLATPTSTRCGWGAGKRAGFGGGRTRHTIVSSPHTIAALLLDRQEYCEHSSWISFCLFPSLVVEDLQCSTVILQSSYDRCDNHLEYCP